MRYDFGFFDKDEGRIEPGPNPFAPEKVLAMSPVQGVNHVTGIHLFILARSERIELPTGPIESPCNSTAASRRQCGSKLDH